MARATAICTCRVCGNQFTKTATKYNRREADSWEEWAVQNYDLCPTCWGAEQRRKEAEQPLTLEVFIDPYSQQIILMFTGNTKPVKDQINSLGYFWGQKPSTGIFGVLDSSTRYVWSKIISNPDDLKKEFDAAKILNPVLKNNITSVDLAMYAQVHTEKQAKEDAINAEIAKLAKPERPTAMDLIHGRWNGKIYGKSGNKTVYLNDNKTSLSDEDAEAIEKYCSERKKYNDVVNEIKRKGGLLN